ncbi:hypothetical protein [Flavobacterium sp.]|uniref:hypothetical protein n=1 Tax=Flavobacterium sp. TaxID=239 RepID=UPI002633ECB6|nr:hypothetical protein [Flavobacterium sp.]
MKNLFRNVFAMLSIAMLSSSCDVGDDKELDYGNGSYVAQFPYASKTAFFAKDDAVVYDYTMPIQIVGGNGLALSNDLAVVFEVDAANTTAVAGLHYDFVGSTSLTIPANSTFATIPMKVYSGNLDDQNPPVLTLKLVSATGVSGVVTSGNKGVVALTLQGTCTSDLAGSYSTAITRLSPAGGPYGVATENITSVGEGEYLTQATGNFTLAAFGLTLSGPWNNLSVPAPQGGFVFKEVCGRVAVEEQNLFEYYSNLVQQTPAQYAVSTVNPLTGVITIEYTVTFAAGNRTFRSVYTPL